jgi:hypothetical protein
MLNPDGGRLRQRLCVAVITFALASCTEAPPTSTPSQSVDRDSASRIMAASSRLAVGMTREQVESVMRGPNSMIFTVPRGQLTSQFHLGYRDVGAAGPVARPDTALLVTLCDGTLRSTTILTLPPNELWADQLVDSSEAARMSCQ